MARSNDRLGWGALLGIGLAAGVAVLIRSTQTASAATRPLSNRMPTPEFPHGRSRFPALVERWRNEVAKRAKDLPVPAILEWIRIESGGDMCAVGLPNEAGIFQLMFPDDARYGATLEGLRALCRQSKQRNPSDISWMSESDLDMQVGAGIRKVQAARDDVRRIFAQHHITWPENSFDFGSAVKQIHAAPAVISELLPKLVRQGGAPTSWKEMRQRALMFPADQLGTGLRRLAGAPSKHGLKNRLEDTMYNAEIVGRMWAAVA